MIGANSTRYSPAADIERLRKKMATCDCALARSMFCYCAMALGDAERAVEAEENLVRAATAAGRVA